MWSQYSSMSVWRNSWKPQPDGTRRELSSMDTLLLCPIWSVWINPIVKDMSCYKLLIDLYNFHKFLEINANVWLAKCLPFVKFNFVCLRETLARNILNNNFLVWRSSRVTLTSNLYRSSTVCIVVYCQLHSAHVWCGGVTFGLNRVHGKKCKGFVYSLEQLTVECHVLLLECEKCYFKTFCRKNVEYSSY